jgi:POT family proton-dependent oligopeptide transporter
VNKSDKNAGDQLPQGKPQVLRQKNGKLVVVDSSRTLQLLYNAFYWSVIISTLASPVRI